MWVPTLKQSKDAVEKAAKAVDERTKEREAAEAKCKEAGNPPVLEDLVKQKRSMEQQARDYLSKKERTEMVMQMSADEVKKDMDGLKEEIGKLNAKAAAIEKTVAQLKEELKLEEKKAEEMGGSRAEMDAALNQAKLDYEQAKAKVGEQKHVRPYFVKILDEHKQATSEARKAVANAEKALKLEKFGLDKQIHDAAKAVHRGQELQKDAKDAQAEVAKGNKCLEENLAEHKKAVQELEARKPEIVKMHGLGLISKLGY